LKATLMLEKKSGSYEILDLPDNDHPQKKKVLVLRKLTETGEPFLVVAGYFLSEVSKLGDDSLLAEIETVPEKDYSAVKHLIRKQKEEGVPITFW
jgi:hypothetical protein